MIKTLSDFASAGRCHFQDTRRRSAGTRKYIEAAMPQFFGLEIPKGAVRPDPLLLPRIRRCISNAALGWSLTVQKNSPTATAAGADIAQITAEKKNLCINHQIHAL